VHGGDAGAHCQDVPDQNVVTIEGLHPTGDHP
jgi:hypothetical protein